MKGVTVKSYNNVIERDLSVSNIHYIYKTCGKPLQIVDSTISATPFADRGIKLSTQPCNLHRQKLAVGWQFSNKSVCQISALLELRLTVNAVIVKWKCLGAITAQQRSGRPHKFTERDR